MIKLVDIVREIGEGSADPYKFSFDFEEVSNFNRPTIYTYTFELDDQPGYKGKIILRHFEEGMGTWGSDKLEGLSIEFNVVEKEEDGVKSDFKTTNLGVKTMFRIMSTVIAVIKDVTRRVDGSITHFRFDAADTKASSIGASGKAQRVNIYDRFIKNAFPVKEKEVDDDIAIYRLNKPLNEGVIKNISLAALVSLAAAAGVSNDAQAQIRNKAQDSGEKIVNVVNNKGQAEFRDIAEFKKHFENNIEDYQAIGIKPNSEFFIIVNETPLVGYIGVSKDMQTSLKKAGMGAVKAGKKSGFLLRDVQKTGNNFVGVVLYRI